MEQLLSYGAGILGSIILGAVKRNTTLFDSKIGDFIKPVQPAIVFGLSIGLPLLGNAIGITDIPDATVFANAPTATLVAITAREIFKRLQK